MRSAATRDGGPLLPAGGKMHPHVLVHRVEAKLFAVVDEQIARLVLREWPQWIVGILLPVDQIGRRGQVARPLRRLRVAGRPMVTGVIAVLVLDDLIEGDEFAVVFGLPRT